MSEISPVAAAGTPLLRHRPYVILLAARTISMMGFAFAPVALAFGILRLPQGNATMLSTVLAAQMIPQVLLLLFGGVVADRYPRARILQLGLLLAAIGWMAIGAMMLFGYTPLLLMCGASVLVGVAASVVSPALTGIIPELVPDDQRQQGNAWISMGASTARLVGLVSSGGVVVLVGGGWAVVGAGLLYLSGAILAAFLPLSPAASNDESNPLAQLRQGWGEFRSRQWLWVCVLQYTFIVMMLQAFHGVLGPLVANAELDGALVIAGRPLEAAAAWSVVLGGEALGAITGVILALLWHPKRGILVGVILTLLAGLPPILMGAGWSLGVVIAASVGMGLAFELFGVFWLTAMQAEVPPESLSRVAAYDAFGSFLLGPLGVVLAAPAANLLGPHQAMVICGVVIVVATLAALAFPDVWRPHPPR